MKVPPQLQGNVSFYQYTPVTQGYQCISQVAINGGQGVGQLIIDSGSDFCWVQGVFSAFANVGGTYTDITAAVPATVQIVDSSDNVNVFSTNAAIRNAFGTAQFPYYLPEAITFLANTTLNVTVTNLSTAGNPVDFYLTLAGFKRYQASK